MRTHIKATNKPYHIEARELGVQDFVAIKKIGHHNISATELRKTWDYRAANLAIDEAREYLKKWNRHSFHRTPSVPATGGRITTMLEIANRNKIAYQKKMKEFDNLADDGLSWSRTRISWEVEGRIIITVRHEDTTWSDRRSYHYPISSSVSYTSHLLRTVEPGTVEAYGMNTYNILEPATEKQIGHDLRGNWKTRVAKELLNVDYRAEEIPAIFFKKVAVCPAFPDSVFASVYDASPYQIGVTRIDRAMRNHNGGLYCYKTAEEAKDAPFPSDSALKHAQKCIVSVRVSGKRIRYESGKYAVSEMTPIEVVA
jgi:hypothetical protein